MRYQMTSLLLLLLAVAGTQSQGEGGRGPPGRGPGGGEGRSSDGLACGEALAPTDAEMTAMEAASTLCIAQQPGLQDVIDTIKANHGDRRRRSPRRGGGGGGPPGGPGGRHDDIAGMLEHEGYTTEATALRECMAGETGQLDGSGAFDDAALQADIATKVAGQTIEANTLLGTTNCGTVVEFDLGEYMRCILTYCATGSAR